MAANPPGANLGPERVAELEAKVARSKEVFAQAYGRFPVGDLRVIWSGGKDSTLALYHIKKRYGMTPLAFTFDHGFENEEALRNVRSCSRVPSVTRMKPG